MGDIADMMLDGTLCEGCGVYLTGKSLGIPRYCHDCAKEVKALNKTDEKVKCTLCGKRVTLLGINPHMRDKHYKNGNK